MKLLRRNRNGQVLLLVACFMLVGLGVAALAVDLGIAYGVRAKLNAAVDAAAIAAGRVVFTGSDVAVSEATSFVRANFPAGGLGATLQDITVNPVYDSKDQSWTVTVTATASVATYFAKVLGQQSLPVEATASSTIRTVDLMLVLDCSGSLNTPSTTLSLLQDATKKFISSFDPNVNRIGLVHFAGGAVLDVPISTTRGFDRQRLNGIIDNLSFVGSTTSEEALRIARQQLDNPNIPTGQQSSLRAIVFFTDGAPNGVAANFAGIPGGPVALYSEVDSDVTDRWGNPTTNCPGNNLNILLPPRGLGDWKATIGFNIAVQDSGSFANGSPNGTHGFDYCSIGQTLPNQDYTGSVDLASYNPAITATRSFSYNKGNILNTRCNVNMAARNMLENIAYAARTENPRAIRVYTIGLGNSLTDLEINFCGYNRNRESGVNILQRLANVPGVDTYNANEPTGAFALATDGQQLNDAFMQIASSILRLTK